MTMSKTLELLALPAPQAHQQIVAELLHQPQEIANLEIGAPYIRYNGTVGLPVTPTDAAESNPDWPYHGGADVFLRRVALEDFFAGLDLKVKLPATQAGGLDTTSNAVADVLSEIFQIHFDPSDYYSDAIVSRGSIRYTFRATPLSPRWSGQVPIHLYPA